MSGLHFAPGRREPGKLSGALIFDKGFEEPEEILLGHEADDDNHSRLFGCASQNKSRTPRGNENSRGQT